MFRSVQHLLQSSPSNLKIDENRFCVKFAFIIRFSKCMQNLYWPATIIWQRNKTMFKNQKQRPVVSLPLLHHIKKCTFIGTKLGSAF